MFNIKVEKKLFITITCLLLASCNSGTVASQSNPALMNQDLDPDEVSVPELDNLISSDHPLSVAELYKLYPDKVEHAFNEDPNESKIHALDKIKETASKISTTQKQHLSSTLLSLEEPDYTYLFCYGEAWLTKDGKKYPVTGATKNNFYLKTWAIAGQSGLFPSYIKIKVQVPSHSIFDLKDNHMVYFLTQNSYAELKDSCKSVLYNYAKQLTVENYPGNTAPITVSDVTIRGRHNSLSDDHPLLPLTGSYGDHKIHTLVSFGDSLSDTDATSNLLLHIIPNRQTWFAGHFTNGWTWPEYAADKLNLTPYNEAWGAAGVNNQPVIDMFPFARELSEWLGLIFPSIYQQNQTYYTNIETNSPRDPDETLYTLLIGGNDFVNYGETSATVLQKVSETVKFLIEQNHAKKIVLLNLPNLVSAPIFNGSKAAIKNTVGTKTIEYNAGLSTLLSSLSAIYPNATIKLFDTNALFTKILANPSDYGFINGRDACLISPSEAYSDITSMNADCNGENYVFWDSLHPTTAIHKILGNAFADFILSEPSLTQ